MNARGPRASGWRQLAGNLVPWYVGTNGGPRIGVRPTELVYVHRLWPPRSFPATYWTLMISRTAVVPKARTACPSAPYPSMMRLRFISLLLLSAWCGAVAGLLEVGTILVRKGLF